ncbi:MAG: hypothetical protein KDD89_11585, partial [Anaerolineales bacterium]|nr:hypothetical protein [Anaerolineales bacterium]
MGLPFLTLTVFWLLGIALARYVPLGDLPSRPTAVFLLLTGGTVALLAFFYWRRNPRQHGRVALLIASAAFLALGTGRAIFAQPIIDASHI